MTEQIEVTFRELCMADEGFLYHIVDNCDYREGGAVWSVPVSVIEQYPTRLDTKEPLLPSEQEVLSAKMIGAMEIFREAATLDDKEKAEKYRNGARDLIQFVHEARKRLEAA